MIQLSELTGNYVLDTTDSKLAFVVPTMLVAKVRGQFDAIGEAGGLFVGDRVTLELDLAAVKR